MPLFLSLLLILWFPSTNADWPPSLGYWPSSKLRPMSFYSGFRNLWGPNHQTVDQSSLTIWLDRTSEKKVDLSLFVLFIRVSLVPPLSFNLLSNNEVHPGFHDEVDMEFLGTTFGKPYTLQTNVYIRGSGDGKIIGREMKFHLWFDPTTDFHHYIILWSPKEVVFLVDDVPIRRYPRKSDATFPLRPMWVNGSIWDASSWATEDGKYKADYRYQPFVAKYTNFKAGGCSAYAPAWCCPVSASPFRAGGLTMQQYRAMRWVQRYHTVYDYCRDPKRSHALTPECWSESTYPTNSWIKNFFQLLCD
ncbi:hypothetical protein E1A91_D01G161400v1 [Gossypium mustelinum]|uniref:Xyloglucan endotransglucosylase/hydrolase n=1 Tax=Gossypium mustelinum TaxID=34275 RepID=A0A5D2W849_GOSMU|nr:hypothetical protein E1A91_D01G161400v1 [Gossypium mustelinum]